MLLNLCGCSFGTHSVERACALLEHTDLLIDEIAVAAGFGPGGVDAVAPAGLGVSTTAYRATFRGR